MDRSCSLLAVTLASRKTSPVPSYNRSPSPVILPPFPSLFLFSPFFFIVSSFFFRYMSWRFRLYYCFLIVFPIRAALLRYWRRHCLYQQFSRLLAPMGQLLLDGRQVPPIAKRLLHPLNHCHWKPWSWYFIFTDPSILTSSYTRRRAPFAFTLSISYILISAIVFDIGW